MFDANKNGSSCGLGEEAVSYLYGEMEEPQKHSFEVHLNSCLACREEIAGLGMASGAVRSWKESDFMPLAIPSVDIPYQAASFIEAKEDKRPWWPAISELFTLSPAWAKATAAFAALAVCAGLVYFAVSSKEDNGRVVAGVNKEAQPKMSPTPPAASGSIPQVGNTDEKPESNASAPPKPIEAKSRETAASPSSKGFQRAVVVEKPQIPAKPKNGGNPKPSPKTSGTAPKKQVEVPNLAADDEEDDSLRLSDLFEEIDSK